MKPELIDRGEQTISLPPNVDFRAPGNRVAPWDRATTDADIYRHLGLTGLAGIPHDQLMQQSLNAQMQGGLLSGIQMQGQQSAFDAAAHASGIAIDRWFRP